MSSAPELIDRQALAAHRARAAKSPALFLHEAARDEIQDRLSMVNRGFKSVAIVSPFAQIWHGMFDHAHIVSDDDVLDLQENSHDLVIHAMCLHWANDPVGQLIQCKRALRPDGLLLVACLGGQTLHELRSVLGQAEIETLGGLSPRVLPMAEIRDLGALLQRAGLALPVADSWPLKASYESALHLMRDLRAMGETNALAQRLRRTAPRSVMMRAASLYAQEFGSDDGRVSATFEIITLTGWAPDESQPKPLRPGSASARLADALNTNETPLKD
ncbi:methyltransferase domain-containing protein [Thalassococcus lentus]|uniref:Methyltransferase domain-containing protein n=1 Tax=Thalassococcus lentus TaxID=1210524 RepID=A0ABT4XNB3_9RHOB|nr:methyltransferase domain-containing protein [Thalassococcus lentus]MDA7423438.1 methyltransferase domain-containing protein [Thalassococcus lentus]